MLDPDNAAAVESKHARPFLEYADRVKEYVPEFTAGEIDRLVHLTIFPNEYAKSLKVETLMREVRDLIAEITAAEKSKLPYLKMAAFGTKRSEGKSLRNNENVLTIGGVEGDYDDGEVSVSEAIEKIKAAHLSALIYATAGHEEAFPKWRVLCPTSREMPPEQRAGLVARINGVLGGILDPASFTLSQSFHFGSVEGKPRVKAVIIDGDFVDLRADLDHGAIGRRITAADGGAPRLNNMEPADPEKVRAALAVVPSDDYQKWLYVGGALYREFGDDGFEMFDEWSAKSKKHDAVECKNKWEKCKKVTEHTVGTIFYYANEASPGWRAALRGISLDEFRSYMQAAGYIFMPTGDMWPASKVNARLGKIPIADGKTINATTWLDQNSPVEQITWALGLPTLMRDRLVVEGGWIVRPEMTCFNLYKPPTIEPGDANEAGPWIDHVRKVYPDDADHIMYFLAHRVQKPGEKVNHALLLGGAQGIGKDTILEPVKRAVGPWNFVEASPKQVLGRFNAFLRSIILRINEVRDLGEVDRFAFYEHMKAYTASPPDVLRVDEKNLREYSIFNCCGVVYTTNKKDSFYLPDDDRRTYVAWSDLKKEDFTDEYWKTLWRWYAEGGNAHVAAYLAALDILLFNPKAPPPKTAVFWEIVTINLPPEDAELADALDRLGNPPAVTIAQIASVVSTDNTTDFYDWLTNRKNNRVIPHRMEKCGYVSVRNTSRNDGRWLIGNTRHVIYCRMELSVRDRHIAAAALVEEAPRRGQP